MMLDFVAHEQMRLAGIRKLFDELTAGARPSVHACIELLSPAMPLLAQLHGTAQDDATHAEGDALTHTAMVIDALYDDLSTAGLDAAANATLIIAAVLHDIGKVLTTRGRMWFGEQRTVAPGHAREGRWYVAPILFNSGLDPRASHSIAQLIGHHELPFELPAKDASAAAYTHTARLVDPVLLYRLARANARGRKSEERERLCESVEMFRMFAIEYEAFETAATARDTMRERIVEAFPGERTRTFDYLAARAARDLESGLIASPEQAIARSYGHLEYPELVVMVGPQASGKTHYIEDRLRDHRVITGEPREAREQIRVAMRAKERVVYDAPNLTSDVRDRTCKLGLDYNALVTLVVMTASEAVRHERLGDTPRADEPPLQWPEIDEGHLIRLIDGNGRELLRVT